MAFNPFVTFQKNRRFWMAAILMICMVSFVFCTGLKGDMADRFNWLLGGRGGQSAFTLDGRTYTSQQIHQLRDQRNLANRLMMNCADMAFKKLSLQIYELEKPAEGVKPDEVKARQQRRGQLIDIRKQIGYRKAKSRYFELGIKFDDLVEFAMWQVMADRMGIDLEDYHVTKLFFNELYAEVVPYLELHDINKVEQETSREFHDVTQGYIRRAIKEEFRVRIAQEAYYLSQPFTAFYLGRRQEGLAPRFINPDIPDQIRAPLTPAQLWDLFKKNRSDFDVTLLKINVNDYIKSVKAEPTEDEKAKYYASAKDRPADPSSDVPGLQLPSRVKIKYVYADANSPAYLETAKLVERLKGTTPFVGEAAFSPLAAAVRVMGLDALYQKDLQAKYDELGMPRPAFDPRSAPMYAETSTPILFWYAKRHPEAIASFIADPLLLTANPYPAVAGLVAWGAVKHKDEYEQVMAEEAKRRAPHYAALIGVGAADEWGAAANFLALEYRDTDMRVGYPKLPLIAVKQEIETMIARRLAEEKAQQNMQIVRTALEKADGDADKYKRELNRLVPELKLTVGPPGDKQDTYYNRYTIDEAKELAPLKEAYARYIDAINMFEARDMTPERLLKAGDFHKIFFGAEPFSASALNRAMPWPPVVTRPNQQRIFGIEDPRLIDRSKIAPVLREQFTNFVGQNNPLAPLPAYDGLFKNAEKPMLFWRTAERDPKPLPADYAKIATTMKKIDEEYKAHEPQIAKQTELVTKIQALQAELKKSKNDPKQSERLKKELAPITDKLRRLEKESGGTVADLRAARAALKEDEADLKEVQRAVIEGWKFEQARSKNALPAADAVAEAVISDKASLATEAQKLGTKVFMINKLSAMYPEIIGEVRDYTKTPLPKDKFIYPRDDTIDQALKLADLKDPLTIGNKELDDINKKLFERAKKRDNARGHFVQILTNKPRSEFYVAQMEFAPKASMEEFIMTMKLASIPIQEVDRQLRFQRHNFIMDRFVERIHTQEARRYRDAQVESLKRSMEYALENEKFKGEIDDTKKHGD